MFERIRRYLQERRERKRERFRNRLRETLLRIHGRVENIDDRVDRLVSYFDAQRAGRHPLAHEQPHRDDVPYIEKRFDVAEAMTPKALPRMFDTTVKLARSASLFNRR